MTALAEAVRAKHLAAIEACVPVMAPGDGLTVRDIWHRLNYGSLVWVRHMLVALVEQRRVSREPGNNVCLYRRAGP